jgi:uncharacterized protein (DUF1697 family)
MTAPGPSTYAAFLRNVNLGRPRSPTRAQLEAAFLESGAATARSFLVNGTLVFTPAAGRRARDVAARACAAMQASCGLAEPVFVRSVAALAELVARDPFDGIAADGEDAHCITFLGAHRAALPALPFVTPRGDVELHAFTGDEALSVSRRVGASSGSPNALLERWFDTSATTRSWRTVVRLVEKFA